MVVNLRKTTLHRIEPEHWPTRSVVLDSSADQILRLCISASKDPLAVTCIFITDRGGWKKAGSARRPIERACL